MVIAQYQPINLGFNEIGEKGIAYLGKNIWLKMKRIRLSIYLLTKAKFNVEIKDVDP